MGVKKAGLYGFQPPYGCIGHDAHNLVRVAEVDILAERTLAGEIAIRERLIDQDDVTVVIRGFKITASENRDSQHVKISARCGVRQDRP
jgi:hypothetical protein